VNSVGFPVKNGTEVNGSVSVQNENKKQKGVKVENSGHAPILTRLRFDDQRLF